MATRLMDALDTMKHEGSFSPKPIYSRAGDALFFYFDEAESYAERVDGVMTVYRAIDGDIVTGCQIKGVTALIEKFGEFGVSVEDGQVSLGFLFLVSNLEGAPSERSEVERQELYRNLVRRAGRERIDTRDFVNN